MTLPVAPAFDRIRLIPRPNDFLNRNVGASGELFYDKNTETLRVFNGLNRGGREIITEENLRKNTANAEVATVKYDVTITSEGSQNKYVLNGEVAPAINLVVGFTYLFDQSDSTNEFYPNVQGGDANPHPIIFSSDNVNGSLGGGTDYTNNVLYKLEGLEVTKDTYINKFAQSTDRQVQITITKDTPLELYYACSRHTGMGGIGTRGYPGSGGGGASLTISDSVPEDPDAGQLWFNSASGFLYVYYEDTDTSQWIQPVAGNVFSGDYDDLVNVPTFATVATSGLYTDLQGTPVIPATLLDLGIIDGTVNQVLTTDGAGNFSFQTSTGGGGDQSLNTTDDVTFNSITANELLSAGTGVSTITSASTLNFNATDGVFANSIPLPTNIGILDMTAGTWSGNNSSGVTQNGTGDCTITFSNPLLNYAVSATIQTDTATTAMSVQIIRTSTNVRVLVFAADGTTGVNADVLLTFYEGV